MAPVFSRLSDSLVSDWTGVESKIYTRPSLWIGALPPSPEDDSWLNFTDRAWFAPCLGEDWVRLAFLFPASAAAAGARLPTHTCGVVLRSIQEYIPTVYHGPKSLCLSGNSFAQECERWGPIK